MKLTFQQRLLISVLNIPLSFISYIDDLQDIPQRLLGYFGRFVLLILIVMGIVTSYELEKQNSGTLALTYYQDTNRITDDVLGLQASRELPYRISPFSENPKLRAVSAYAVDLDSGKILFELNPDTKIPPASTTKIMTALIALDLYDLSEVLNVPEFCTDTQSQSEGFFVGEKVLVEDLLNTLLISSAGDSACTLANSKISGSTFVELMNLKAKDLGLQNTVFSNPIGLDDYSGNQLMSAKDLTILSREALSYATIKEIVSTTEFSYVSESGVPRVSQNTNKLLQELPNSKGVKTGKTDAAGEVLSYYYEDEDKKLLITVMGSENRFEDTKTLLNWILTEYTWSVN